MIKGAMDCIEAVEVIGKMRWGVTVLYIEKSRKRESLP